MNGPTAITYDALGHILVNSFGSGLDNGSVSEFDAVSGATINANLIGTVPEPSSVALVVAAAAAGWRRRRRRHGAVRHDRAAG